MQKETRPFIPWELVDDFMTAVFVKLGLPEDDARLCSDVLMQSDKWGIESHGCNRFKPIYVDRIRKGILNPVTKIDVLKETPTTPSRPNTAPQRQVQAGLALLQVISIYPSPLQSIISIPITMIGAA